MRIFICGNGDVAMRTRDPLDPGENALAEDLPELNDFDDDYLVACCDAADSAQVAPESRSDAMADVVSALARRAARGAISPHLPRRCRWHIAWDYLSKPRGGPALYFRSCIGKDW